MKTFKSICIGCGREIEYEYYELGEAAKDGYEVSEDEVGWWDFECPECEWFTNYESIELIVQGGLEGFCVCTEKASEVKNLIKAVTMRFPDLIAEIQNELESEKTVCT